MNIIDLAREAGMEWQGGFSRVVEYATQPELERFAHLVRAQTLEEAAGVCENTLAHHYMEQVIPTHDEVMLLAACADCAAAIRALKENSHDR